MLAFLTQTDSPHGRNTMTRSIPTPHAPGSASDTAVWRWIESIVVFIAGFCLMQFFYSGTGTINGDYVGVPAHDSWYHIKMAALLPQVGLVGQFPWLQYAYFTNAGHDFVSHHYGFHVLLMPFVYAGYWTTGDFATGGRWGICAFFGAILTLYNLLLMHAGVRWRWLWLIAFLVLPSQFFQRHAYVRAIAPSLMFMLAILLLMFKRRYVWSAVVIALYGHLYLGAVMFSPVLVAVYSFCLLFGPREDREFPWKMVLLAVGGWAVGVFTYPYVRGMYEFLLLQVFGSGLTPDIAVGREWKPYENLWWFMGMTGPLFGIWVVALVVRLRSGPRLNGQETALLVLSFIFLLLTCKARRFIEYWPMFALLSSGYMLAPVLAKVSEWWHRPDTAEEPNLTMFVRTATLLTIVAVGIASVVNAFRFLADWGVRPGERDWVALTRVIVGDPSLIIAASAYVAFLVIRELFLRRGWGQTIRSVGVVMIFGVAFVGTATLVAGPNLRGVQRDVRCTYDVKSVRDALAFIERDSQPGDIIFTDDWDEFGLFFYHNHHNYYIVGLDPKFTHARQPALWERFVKITRGQAPTNANVEITTPDGTQRTEQIRISLADIKTHFRAKYVICDRGHRPLRRQLARAPEFAELVYPCTTFEDCDNSPYLVFRIREDGEYREPSQIERMSTFGILHVSRLKPTDNPGPDCYRLDREVGGGRLRTGTKTHLRGIGLRAGCALTFDLPPGFTRLESTLCLAEQTNGTPLAQDAAVDVVVSVDGREIHRRLLTRDAVDVPLSITLPDDAGTITLGVEQRENTPPDVSVNWASARLVRSR